MPRGCCTGPAARLSRSGLDCVVLGLALASWVAGGRAAGLRAGDEAPVGSLTPELCAAEGGAKAAAAARGTLDAATARMVREDGSGPFVGYADGVLALTADNTTGMVLGGGSNPSGYYMTYIFDANASLGPGACDELERGPEQSPGVVCHPLGADEVVEAVQIFFLGPSDAVVFHGCTPPPVHYFGWDMYINERMEEDFIFYPGTNFGDTLSIHDVNTAADDVYDQPAVVIHTADGQASRTVSDAFEQVGVDTTSISTHALNAHELRFFNRSQTWEDSRPDVLFMLQRVTEPFPGYEEAYERYKVARFPVRIFFGPRGEPAREPLAPVPVSRETDPSLGLPTEVELLSDPVEDLKEAVKEAMTERGAHFKGATTVTLDQSGYYDDWDTVLAAQSNDSYIIPTRDAGYGSPLHVMGDVNMTNTTGLVLVGVVHTKNGTRTQARFSSLGLDVFLDAPCNGTECLVRNVHYTQWITHSEVSGSAERYLPDDDLVDHLFAVDFLPHGACETNGWASDWCYEFGKGAFVTTSPGSFIPILGERIYCLYNTGVGGSALESITVYGLIFDLSEASLIEGAGSGPAQTERRRHGPRGRTAAPGSLRGRGGIER